MSQHNANLIYRFIADPAMSEEVKNVLLESFMKKRTGDVNMKAAQMMAIDLLQEGWKELERYKTQQNEAKISRQVGI